jgi:plastocyanin
MKPFAILIAAVLLASPLQGQVSDWSGAPVIQVELSNFAFAPNIIHLMAGVPVQLHILNTTTSGHTFSSPEFIAASIIRSEDRPKVEKGAIEVKGFASIDVRLIPRAGTYVLQCSHVLHSAYGMRGQIVVE